MVIEGTLLVIAAILIIFYLIFSRKKMRSTLLRRFK